jgi:uncharacterized membrane protein (UPF0127 family)
MRTRVLAGADANGLVRMRHRPTLCLTSVDGGSFIQVRVARTFVSRFVGLLNRSDLGGDEGLLLVPGGSIHTLWMQFAIDVIFLDESWKILRVAAEVPPWRWVHAPRRTRFVLELAAGRARAAAFKPGATLQSCRQQPTVSRTRSDASPQV